MLNLKEFKLDLRHNERVGEIFDAYRLKLTGSLDCRNDHGIFDFIYREQPLFQSEILLILYQIGYEDALKEAARQAMPFAGQDEEDYAAVNISSTVGAKANLKLVVDNTMYHPHPDPPPANSAVGLVA